MKPYQLLFVAITFTCGAGMWAQHPGMGPRHGNMDFMAHEMMSKPVKGAPFAADAVTTTSQALPNGTHIARTATASVYRDSEGRTRREENSLAGAGALSVAGASRPTVFIHDPVSSVAYVLNPQSKTAHKMAFSPRHGANSTAAGAADAGRESTAAAEPGLGAHGPQHFAGNAKTESLGKQVIEGIEVEGTRRTITVPAGAIGNDQPIQSVTERWYSSDLQVVVKSVHNDPRFGQTVYQLSNIRRGEQPANLFEIPTDFTVTTGGRGQKANQ